MPHATWHSDAIGNKRWNIESIRFKANEKDPTLKTEKSLKQDIFLTVPLATSCPLGNTSSANRIHVGRRTRWHVNDSI